MSIWLEWNWKTKVWIFLLGGAVIISVLFLSPETEILTLHEELMISYSFYSVRRIFIFIYSDRKIYILESSQKIFFLFRNNIVKSEAIDWLAHRRLQVNSDTKYWWFIVVVHSDKGIFIWKSNRLVSMVCNKISWLSDWLKGGRVMSDPKISGRSIGGGGMLDT